MIVLGLVFVSCFGFGLCKGGPKTQNSYVECRPGRLDIILAAPHGGSERPSDIPDRDAGCWDSTSGKCIYIHNCGVKDMARCSVSTAKDRYTRELAEKVADELDVLFGERPTIVLNLLHRSKLDANRDVDEATFGESVAIQAWNKFHQCIDDAKTKIIRRRSRGLFLDMHGHSHTEQKAELGYLVSGNLLDSGVPIDPLQTSIKSLAYYSRLVFDQLLRGPPSFGDHLTAEGYDSVPSSDFRGPNGAPYYSGGYNTKRHGSRDGTSAIDAIQIESSSTARAQWDGRYGKALARAIHAFYTDHYP